MSHTEDFPCFEFRESLLLRYSAPAVVSFFKLAMSERPDQLNHHMAQI